MSLTTVVICFSWLYFYPHDKNIIFFVVVVRFYVCLLRIGVNTKFPYFFLYLDYICFSLSLQNLFSVSELRLIHTSIVKNMIQIFIVAIGWS